MLCRACLGTQPGFELSRAPQEINCRKNQQLHHRRSDNAADHRGGDAFHDVCAGAVAPQDWQKAGDDDCGRHGFRTHALYGAVINRITQLETVAHLPFMDPLIVSEVKVEKHDDARFCAYTCERNQPYPHGDAQVIAVEVKHPERTNQGQRYREHDDEGFSERPRVEVNDQDDDQERNRNHDHEPLLRAQHIFILAAPGNVVAAWKLNGLLGNGVIDRALGPLNISAHIDAFDIHVDPGVGHRAFTFNAHRGAHDIYPGKLAQWNLGPARSWHDNLARRFE